MAFYEILPHDRLDAPVLVVATDGWVDAGYSAAGAVAAMIGGRLLSEEPEPDLSTPDVLEPGVDGPAEIGGEGDRDAEASDGGSRQTFGEHVDGGGLASGDNPKVIVVFDDEEFLDRRARRPTLRIEDGVASQLTWPSTQIVAGADLSGKAMAFLVGPEPDYRWRSFVNAVMSVCGQLGVRMVVGLGAFPAAVPHTRPVRLASTAPRPYSSLAHRTGVIRGTIEVPTGIWGAIEQAMPDMGIPAVGLWARIPHYVAGMAFPAGSIALINGLAEVAELNLPVPGLMTAADAAISRVDKLIGRSAEHLTMVHDLERSVDEAEGNAMNVEEMPTGDEIAVELERYLRSRRYADGGGGAEGGDSD